MLISAKYLKPRFIFLGLFFAFYALLLATDIFHATTNGVTGVIYHSFTGSAFLALCLSIFATTVFTIADAKFRQSMSPWLSASLMSLFLIYFSFFAFYSGRRIVTEADGPASVGYSCVWSELSDTVDALTGTFSNAQPDVRNKNLCILKNMPLSASNYGSWAGNQDLWEFAILIVYLGLVSGSYFGSRHLLRALTKE